MPYAKGAKDAAQQSRNPKDLTTESAKKAEREPEFLTAKYGEYAKGGRNLLLI